MNEEEALHLVDAINKLTGILETTIERLKILEQKVKDLEQEK